MDGRDVRSNPPLKHEPMLIRPLLFCRRKPLIASSADNLRIMGQTGRKRVLAEFSREKMISELNKEIQRLSPSPDGASSKGGSASNVEITTFHVVLGCIAMVAVILASIFGMKIAAQRLVQRQNHAA